MLLLRLPHHVPCLLALQGAARNMLGNSSSLGQVHNGWPRPSTWPFLGCFRVALNIRNGQIPKIAHKKHIQGKMNCGVAMAQNWIKIIQVHKMWVPASQMHSFQDLIVRIWRSLVSTFFDAMTDNNQSAGIDFEHCSAVGGPFETYLSDWALLPRSQLQGLG